MKPRIPLHRGSIEADESCATEGSALHPHDWRNNQGRPIPKAPRIHRNRKPASLGFVYTSLLWVVGVVALIAGAAALMP